MPAARAIIRKLESVFALTPEERQVIESLPVQFRDAKAGETIVREGDRPSQCCVVLSGLGCRFKIVEDGHRQIMSFQMSGDLPDLQSLHLDVMDHDIGMLRAGKVAFVPHAAVHAMNANHPRIAAALWRNTLIDAAIFRQWMVGIGSKSAYGRVAHLLCELAVLAEAVGLSQQSLEHTPNQGEIVTRSAFPLCMSIAP